MRKLLYLMLGLWLIFGELAFAQESILEDLDGDGVVSVLAFGDSITAGLGDGIAPGVVVEDPTGNFGIGGYPSRLTQLLGIPVTNSGVPGEELLVDGYKRFVGVAGKADLLLCLEGANDAIHRADSTSYRAKLQRIINVAKVKGRLPVVLTLPRPCCGHDGSALFTTSYSDVVADLASINQAPMIDLERAWRTTCTNSSECELYNLPEGLHPNTRGYDVMAQTIAAALIGIDIFAPDGAAQLEEALSLPQGTVIVKPGV